MPLEVYQSAVERQDGFVFNDDQFCVKLKTVAINQTKFLSLEKARQQILSESHPIEMIRQTYMNSEKSALVRTNQLHAFTYRELR